MTSSFDTNGAASQTPRGLESVGEAFTPTSTNSGYRGVKKSRTYKSKDSSDKCGWSFRKKSARNRLLSNTIISEMPSSVNKESPETATGNFQTPSTNSAEKTSRMSGTDERPKLSAILNLKEADSIIDREDDTMHVINPDESVVVVIQTAIR